MCLIARVRATSPDGTRGWETHGLRWIILIISGLGLQALKIEELERGENLNGFCDVD